MTLLLLLLVQAPPKPELLLQSPQNDVGAIAELADGSVLLAGRRVVTEWTKDGLLAHRWQLSDNDKQFLSVPLVVAKKRRDFTLHWGRFGLDGKLKREMPEPESMELAIVDDEKTLIAGYDDGRVDLLDAVTLRRTRTLLPANARGAVTSLAVDRANKRIFLLFDRGAFAVIDRTGRVLKEAVLEEVADALHLGHDETYLVAEKTLINQSKRGFRIYGLDGAPLAPFVDVPGASVIDVSPRGDIAVATECSSVHFFSAARAAVVARKVVKLTARCEPRIQHLRYTQGGERVWASGSTALHLLDADGNVLRRVPRNHEAPQLVEFSPDGRRVLLLSTKRGQGLTATSVLSVWSIDGSLEAVAAIDQADAAHWSSDGARIAVTSFTNGREWGLFDPALRRLGTVPKRTSDYRDFFELIGDGTHFLDSERDGSGVRKRLLLRRLGADAPIATIADVDSVLSSPDRRVLALTQLTGNNATRHVSLIDATTGLRLWEQRDALMSTGLGLNASPLVDVRGECFNFNQLTRRWRDGAVCEPEPAPRTIARSARSGFFSGDHGMSFHLLGKEVWRGAYLDAYGATKRGDSVSISPAAALVASTDRERGGFAIRNLVDLRVVHFQRIEDDWIVYDDDGHFDGSPDAGRLLGLRIAEQVAGVDQFAVQLNRPDLLMDALGAKASPELFDAEWQAWLRHQHTRRIERLGAAGAAGTQRAAPTATLARMTVDGDFASFELRCQAPAGALKRFHVYANDVPVFGSSGKPAAGARATLTDRVALTHGFNKLEFSCSNDAGVESVRVLASATRVQESPRRLLAALFGVSDYADPELALKYAHKDALDLAATLARFRERPFSDVTTRVFTNEQVSAEGFAQARALFATTTPDDVVVLFIAGHGVHELSAAARYFFLLPRSKLDALAETAVDFDRIEAALDGVPARQKLFFMDTCESGDAALDDAAAARPVQAGLGSRGIKRSSVAVAGADKRLRLERGRTRYIFNDVSRRAGAMVFSSSRGGELSWESEALKNGLFTAALIGAFERGDLDEDGLVSLPELRRVVADEVKRSSADTQHPTVDRDNLFLRLELKTLGASR